MYKKWIGVSNEMLGRIIGREGRNARAFQETTRTEIEFINSTEFYICCVDYTVLEEAVEFMKELIEDGRITPETIERKWKRIGKQDKVIERIINKKKRRFKKIRKPIQYKQPY